MAYAFKPNGAVDLLTKPDVITRRQGLQLATTLKSKRGFTMAELLIVVAIVAVLVAIAIPVFSNQLEKSREATDLANVRSAYAEVMNAAVLQDTNSELYFEAGSERRYEEIVPLKQAKDDWSMDTSQLVVGGIAFADREHWFGSPKANSHCRVYYSVSNQAAYLKWGGEDHINLISAKDFLTMKKLEEALGTYSFSLINSHEVYQEGKQEGTQRFLDYIKQYGVDLADYGAATWQIYAKTPDAKEYLNSPAIYWSSVDVNEVEPGKTVPVMGYRNGYYDVWYTKVVEHNAGTNTGKPPYKAFAYNFANVTNAENGGSATFQFKTYEDAKAKYDEIFELFKTGTQLTNQVMADYHL